MLKIDAEFKALIPALTKEEFEQLEKNCIAEGIREPIIVWLVPKETAYCPECLANVGVSVIDGDHYECVECGYGLVGEIVIIDGHNRYEIANKHNLGYSTSFKYFDSRDEVIDWMICNQLGRRNLTEEYKSYLRGKRQENEKKKLKRAESDIVSLSKTSEKLAEEYGVSARTIERDQQYAKAIDTIAENTSPEIKQKILNREIEITKKQTQQVAKQEPEKQKAIIDKLVTGEAKSVVDAQRLIKKDEVHDTEELKESDKKYRIIYADPPWRYNDKRDGNTTGAEDHYPTMSLQEICDMPVKELAEDNAVLFLWTTSPLLEDTFKVISSWGFKYKTSFVWDKVKHNMGHYNSVRHEFLLVCTRGSCTPDNVKLFDSVQSIERTEHSVKPEEFRDIIDTLYTRGNKIELFSRKQVEGWDVWGNQS
jgi:N6-adenosine-specific RNA methylase IME4